MLAGRMERFDLLPESFLATAGLPVLGAVVALALAAVGLSVRRELVKRAAVRAFALAFDAPDPSPIDAGPTVLAGRLESEEKGTPPIVVRKRQSKRPWARRWDDGEEEVIAQPCTLVLHGTGRRVKVAIDSERVAVHTEKRLSPLLRGADERRERTQTLEIADGETVLIEGYLDGPLEPAGDEDYRNAPPTLRAPEFPHLQIHGRGEIENGRRCSANGFEARMLLALPVLLLVLGLAFEAGVRALEVSVVGEVTNIRDERASSKSGSVMVPRFDVTFLPLGAFHSQHHLRCDRLLRRFDSSGPPLVEGDLVRLAYLPGVPSWCELGGARFVNERVGPLAVVVGIWLLIAVPLSVGSVSDFDLWQAFRSGIIRGPRKCERR